MILLYNANHLAVSLMILIMRIAVLNYLSVIVANIIIWKII